VHRVQFHSVPLLYSAKLFKNSSEKDHARKDEMSRVKIKCLELTRFAQVGAFLFGTVERQSVWFAAVVSLYKRCNLIT